MNNDNNGLGCIAGFALLPVMVGFIIGGLSGDALTGGAIGCGITIVLCMLSIPVYYSVKKSLKKKHVKELEQININPGMRKCKEFYEACVKTNNNPYKKTDLSNYTEIANLCGGIKINSIFQAQDMYLLGADQSGIKNIIKLIGAESKKNMEIGSSFYALCKKNDLQPGVNGTIRDYKLLAQKCGITTINSIEDAIREYKSSVSNINRIISQIEGNTDLIINEACVRYREKNI